MSVLFPFGPAASFRVGQVLSTDTGKLFADEGGRQKCKYIVLCFKHGFALATVLNVHTTEAGASEKVVVLATYT